MNGFSHYQDAEVQRLSTEVQQALAKELKRDRDRLAKLEALAAWVRDDLHPWLVTLAAFVGFADALEDPPR